MLKLKVSTKVVESPKPSVPTNLTAPKKFAWGIPKFAELEPVSKLDKEKSPCELFKITSEKQCALRKGRYEDELRFVLLKAIRERLRRTEEVRYQLAWPKAVAKQCEAPKVELRGPTPVQQKIAADRLLVGNPKPKLVIPADPGYYRRQATKEISPLVYC
ncbi:hypothetical protein CAEBREN_26044 [Caenorhabditis brenneri]|uniref:Uncharacterized protein n=1 Tax=Caenorhabditis brenneri TaxID=135651 RepID=G0MDA9_CAEBE|nr:hypothetical protein CAEBREN_26044 [Caenorhabditis brenneri]